MISVSDFLSKNFLHWPLNAHFIRSKLGGPVKGLRNQTVLHMHVYLPLPPLLDPSLIRPVFLPLQSPLFSFSQQYFFSPTLFFLRDNQCIPSLPIQIMLYFNSLWYVTQVTFALRNFLQPSPGKTTI